MALPDGFFYFKSLNAWINLNLVTMVMLHRAKNGDFVLKLMTSASWAYQVVRDQEDISNFCKHFGVGDE